MDILFNASGCGLGNNGGTKTIIRSTETLQELGHRVRIEANINGYTWHKPDVVIGIPFNSSLWDAVVCVSVWDVDSTIQSKVKNKFWWMRGWEKWVRGEEWLVSQIKKFVAAGGRIIVNSSWLIKQLKEKCGVESELCYSGLDLDIWEDHNEEYHSTIGHLGNRKHTTKRYDLCLQLKEKYSEIFKFIELGKNLNNEQLINLYNQCDIWFAPTELEGFHNVPAEANLCGCLVYCNRLDSNGMGDYATDNTAMRYNTFEELLACIENPDFSKIIKMQEILKSKIGDRKKNMEIFTKLIGG